MASIENKTRGPVYIWRCAECTEINGTLEATYIDIGHRFLVSGWENAVCEWCDKPATEETCLLDLNLVGTAREHFARRVKRQQIKGNEEERRTASEEDQVNPDDMEWEYWDYVGFKPYLSEKQSDLYPDPIEEGEEVKERRDTDSEYKPSEEKSEKDSGSEYKPSRKISRKNSESEYSPSDESAGDRSEDSDESSDSEEDSDEISVMDNTKRVYVNSGTNRVNESGDSETASNWDLYEDP